MGEKAHHYPEKLETTFTFGGKAKTTLLAISGVGLLLVLIGLFTDLGGGLKRLWSSYLLSAFYFTAVSVVALAWIAIKYAAKAGWAVGFKRLTEAMASYLPIAGISFVVLIIASFFGHDQGIFSLYEWSHEDVVANDVVLKGKAPYLNVTGFVIRAIVYFALWAGFYFLFRKLSLREDAEPGTLKWYHKSTYWSAAFLPIFGFSFCMASWDWLMSTEPHWYSTMYGVNIFAGGMVAFICTTVLILTLMKRTGHFEWITENHFHDLGKFMFGFSIFWTYTWVAQFLLIWYANLPEETPYYLFRLHGNWFYLFFANFFVNFVFPLLFLMMRNSKRNYSYLAVVAVILLCGRFIDWYLAIMPGTTSHASGLGAFEIGFFLLFTGIFGFTVGNTLSKAPLLQKNHPFLQESLHHEI